MKKIKKIYTTLWSFFRLVFALFIVLFILTIMFVDIGSKEMIGYIIIDLGVALGISFMYHILES